MPRRCEPSRYRRPRCLRSTLLGRQRPRPRAQDRGRTERSPRHVGLRAGNVRARRQARRQESLFGRDRPPRHAHHADDRSRTAAPAQAIEAGSIPWPSTPDVESLLLCAAAWSLRDRPGGDGRHYVAFAVRELSPRGRRGHVFQLSSEMLARLGDMDCVVTVSYVETVMKAWMTLGEVEFSRPVRSRSAFRAPSSVGLPR